MAALTPPAGYTEQWLPIPTGGVFFWRCDDCAALIKPHALDALTHDQWHNRTTQPPRAPGVTP